MQEGNAGNNDEVAVLRQELALREREIERHRRSSSVRREELKTKRLIAFLSLVGLIVAGGVVFLVADLILKKSTDRSIAIERERMLDNRKLADHEAELEKDVALARAEAASLYNFAAASAGRDLFTQLEMAKLQSEVAEGEAVRARWQNIVEYLEQRIEARREDYAEVVEQIAQNRKRYGEIVTQIVESPTPSLEKEERLTKLDIELASLQASARRILMDLGGTSDEMDEKPQKNGAVMGLQAKETRVVSTAEGAIPIPRARPDDAAAAIDPPTPLSPPDGTVFDHYPRQTIMSWSSVAGAEHYTVEVDCFDCCETDKWCSEVGEQYLMVPGLSVTRYGVNFGNHHVGRWRVWAVAENGARGAKSDWSEFSYAE